MYSTTAGVGEAYTNGMLDVHAGAVLALPGAQACAPSATRATRSACGMRRHAVTVCVRVLFSSMQEKQPNSRWRGGQQTPPNPKDRTSLR